MNLDNPVIKLCIEGTPAEFQGHMDKACALYQKAWESVQNDYEACIAAHYVARLQDDDKERLHWNQVALEKATAVADDQVKEFYPSLYLNMGQSYELLGNRDEAKRYYDLAARAGTICSFPLNTEPGIHQQANRSQKTISARSE
jgi:tetratricopeptide (TPR) repeat protein